MAWSQQRSPMAAPASTPASEAQPAREAPRDTSNSARQEALRARTAAPPAEPRPWYANLGGRLMDAVEGAGGAVADTRDRVLHGVNGAVTGAVAGVADRAGLGGVGDVVRGAGHVADQAIELGSGAVRAVGSAAAGMARLGVDTDTPRGLAQTAWRATWLSDLGAVRDHDREVTGQGGGVGARVQGAARTVLDRRAAFAGGLLHGAVAHAEEDWRSGHHARAVGRLGADAAMQIAGLHGAPAEAAAGANAARSGLRGARALGEAHAGRTAALGEATLTGRGRAPALGEASNPAHAGRTAALGEATLTGPAHAGRTAALGEATLTGRGRAPALGEAASPAGAGRTAALGEGPAPGSSARGRPTPLGERATTGRRARRTAPSSGGPAPTPGSLDETAALPPAGAGSLDRTASLAPASPGRGGAALMDQGWAAGGGPAVGYVQRWIEAGGQGPPPVGGFQVNGQTFRPMPHYSAADIEQVWRTEVQAYQRGGHPAVAPHHAAGSSGVGDPLAGPGGPPPQVAQMAPLPELPPPLPAPQVGPMAPLPELPPPLPAPVQGPLDLRGAMVTHDAPSYQRAWETQGNVGPAPADGFRVGEQVVLPPDRYPEWARANREHRGADRPSREVIPPGPDETTLVTPPDQTPTLVPDPPAATPGPSLPRADAEPTFVPGPENEAPTLVPAGAPQQAAEAPAAARTPWDVAPGTVVTPTPEAYVQLWRENGGVGPAPRSGFDHPQLGRVLPPRRHEEIEMALGSGPGIGGQGQLQTERFQMINRLNPALPEDRAVLRQLASLPGDVGEVVRGLLASVGEGGPPR